MKRSKRSLPPGFHGQLGEFMAGRLDALRSLSHFLRVKGHWIAAILVLSLNTSVDNAERTEATTASTTRCVREDDIIDERLGSDRNRRTQARTTLQRLL